MLAKRKTITHPTIGKIELPLLIPAFSSKGFTFLEEGRGKKKKEYSELANALYQFCQYKWPIVLISAYDLYFKHFISPKLPIRKVSDYLKTTDIVMIDSGGYELMKEFDSTEIKRYMYNPKEGFSKEEYITILDKVVSGKNNPCLIISNFDYEVRGFPLDVQIKKARELFNRYRDCMSNFIIKPLTEDSNYVDPSRISNSDFKNLNGFDMIGVTEKDLGKDLMKRLRRITELRVGLNNSSLEAPIHIWGGLDPIITPLYFFAGAEIFDGVSWLRYAYFNGIAVNRECHLVLNPQRGISTSHELNHAFAGLDNLSFLDNLTSNLQSWVDLEGKDFTMFNENVREYLKNAYNIMKTKIKNI